MHCALVALLNGSIHEPVRDAFVANNAVKVVCVLGSSLLDIAYRTGSVSRRRVTTDARFAFCTLARVRRVIHAAPQ
jgi:hypothetical protein